jgi:formylglycine-generating enzyme required for sulfatase activity
MDARWRLAPRIRQLDSGDIEEYAEMMRVSRMFWSCLSLIVLGSTVAFSQVGADKRTTAPRPKPTPTPTKSTTTKKPPARKPTRSTSSGAKSTQTSTPPTTESTEPEYWETIRNSSDVQDFKDYLEAYPNGAHAAIVRTRIRQLEAAKANPVATPAATPPANTSTTNSIASNLARTRTNQTGIEFVLLPAGSFTMGSTKGEADEKPAHQVTINYSFYMGKYEVTQAQWQSVMGSNPSNFTDCANCPVERVSWNDAQEFIRKLNQMNDGYIYRLPTEAEWEYACRAGTTGDYAGNLSEMAWYSDNSGSKTHAVGGRQPNAWGLFDMHGNVWEWCQDWYHETYYGAPTDGSAWLSGGEQKYRVLRGGSWGADASILRSADRFYNTPAFRSNYYGFRVVAVART